MRIVVTGTPGVGKHSVSRILAGRLGLALVDINAVASDAGLAGPDGVDTDRLGRVLEGLAPERCVIAGHLAPHAVGSADSAIILRRSPYELLGVYRERGYPEEKISENAASEVLGVVAHDAIARFGARAVQIDTTGRSAEQSADAAESCIGGSPGCDVDWLGMVAGRGDLKRFFGD